MSCGVGCRRSLNLTLLWLWRRLVATVPIQPLAWEPPYVTGVAQEMAKSQKAKKPKSQKKKKKKDYSMDSLVAISYFCLLSFAVCKWRYPYCVIPFIFFSYDSSINKNFLFHQLFSNCEINFIPKTVGYGSSPVAQQKLIWLRNHGDLGLIPGLAQWVKDPALPWTVV